MQVCLHPENEEANARLSLLAELRKHQANMYGT